MMKMQDTELECMDCDEVCLDFYLGEGNETKDQWAKRVWDNCKLYRENDGKDLEGNNLARVYARDAESIWEEKKRRRRAAFVKHCTGEECDCELLEVANIDKDLKENRKCEWANSHSTEAIMKLKDDPKVSYKTATEKHREEEEKHQKDMKEVKDKRIAHVNTLRKKFDDETIAIIYPEGERYLKEGLE